MTFLTMLLDSPLLSSLAKTLLHFLWQGTVIAAVLYLALNALQKTKSELRYLCALTSLIACIAAPIATFFWFYRPEITVVLHDSILIGHSLESAAPSGLVSFLNWDTVLPITGMLWIVGVFYLSVHLILELFSVYQLPNRNVAKPEPDILQLFDRLAKQLQVNRLTRLLISLKAEVPMVVGFIRPVVLLPLSMSSGLTHAQLEMLLAHELAHVKRHDYLVNFLQTLVEITLFFHPFVKWISTQIRIEREYCCDDIAVHTCGNVLAYATALTDAESLRSKNIPQLAMAATGGDLKNRVLRIVDQTDCANKFTRSWHSMALAALVGVTLPAVLFSAHAAYLQRVDEALSSQVAEQETDLLVKFVNVKAPKVSIGEKTQVNRISATSAGGSGTQEDVRTSAQSTERSSNSNKASVEEYQEVIVDSELSELVPTELVSNEAVPTESLDYETDKLTKENVQPVLTAEYISDGPQTLPSVVVEQPEPIAVEAADLDLKIATKSSLTQDLEPAEALELSDIELPKVQIASREQLVTIIAPTLVRNARPNYPRMAIVKRSEAEVMVSFTVGVNGTISKLSFDNSVPGYFKRSVRKALREWRFEPGTIDGEIAAIRLSRVFTFSDPTGDVKGSTRMKVTGSRIAKDT